MAEKVVAMILAGGKGTRLQALTRKTAKPAVSFASKYRIIDFPLSNVANSGINVVGVLMQYESTELDTYIGDGEIWGFNGVNSSVTTLSPRQTEEGSNWYEGTADAISKNIDFLDNYNPEYVLILSGDHIYNTNYVDMIKLHEDSKADATISVIEVPIEEAPRFGIMVTDGYDRVIEFQEKPKKPISNLASMGVYVFTWKLLRQYLLKDMKTVSSSHDFGKDIIPQMLADKKKLMAYRYQGYWRDVGTLASLHEANMDIALNMDGPNLYDKDKRKRIYTEDTPSVPQYVGPNGSIKNSIANQGAIILGSVDKCVISTDAIIKEEASCVNCVIMKGAVIGHGARVKNAIIAPNVVIEDNAEINLEEEKIVLVSR